MAEQDWTPSTITLSQLQKLMKHGFMAAIELEACQVPEDDACPPPVEGYVVSFMTYYEWGFNMRRTGSSAHFSGIMASSFTT
jgi:hypothetical protein